MKKMIAILAVTMLLWGASASADTLDFLKPFWMQMMDGVSNTASGKIPENVAVTCADERLTVEACGVLKNTGSERLPIRSVQMTVLGANGNTLHQENYVSYMPSVVEPGETMLVSEWMYDFVKEIGKVDSIQISVETASRAYEKWKQLGDVRAWLDGDYLCVEFTNTTEKTLFGVICAATVSDANGQILDMMMQSPYDTDDLGIAQGSSIVWRKRLEDAATLKIGADAVCKAWAYWMEDL